MTHKSRTPRFLRASIEQPKSPTSTASSSPTAYSPTDSTLKHPPEPCNRNPDPSGPVLGWPSVTELIVRYPDFEAFQTFKDLNIKSLLYYQAELEYLQRHLREVESDDCHEGQSPENKWAKDLSSFVIINEDTDEDCPEQWVLIRKIRSVLKEYNEALLQYSQVSSLPKADPYNVETCRRYLKTVTDHCIMGPGANTWGNLKDKIPEADPLRKQFLRLLRSLFWVSKADQNELDLVVPRAGHKVDSFTRWVATEFVPFWASLKHNLRRKLRPKVSNEELPVAEHKIESLSKVNEGLIQRVLYFTNCWRTRTPSGSSKANTKSELGVSRKRNPLNEYSGNRMLKFTSGFATILACLLPTVAIAVLSSLDSTRVLIGVIAAFTATFAIGLMWLTDASTSRVEIFTATAAFSAVMVVFVQNQNVGLYASGAKVPNGTYVNITNG